MKYSVLLIALIALTGCRTMDRITGPIYTPSPNDPIVIFSSNNRYIPISFYTTFPPSTPNGTDSCEDKECSDHVGGFLIDYGFDKNGRPKEKRKVPAGRTIYINGQLELKEKQSSKYTKVVTTTTTRCNDFESFQAQANRQYLATLHLDKTTCRLIVEDITGGTPPIVGKELATQP